VSRGAPVSPVARIKLLMRLMCEHAAQDMKLTHRAFAARLCYPPPLHHRDGSGTPQARRQLFGLFLDLVAEAQACGEMRADVEAGLVSDLLHLFLFRQIRACMYDAGTAAELRSALPLAESPASGLMMDLLMDGLAGPNWRHA